MTSQNAAAVRAVFEAFVRRDRATVDRLLADNFTFSSPNDDDHISKTAYFEKCWPGGEQFRSLDILELVEAGDAVLIRYEAAMKDGKRFRNMEWLRVADGQIVDEEVYFGRSV